MNVAMKLFAENGFNATSVRDIAKAAGVNLAMINYYFISKNNLLLSIFNYMGNESKSYLDSIIVNERFSVFQRFDYVIENYVRFALDHKDFMVIMMRQQFNESIPEVQEKIYQLKERYWRIFYLSLEEAKKQKIFKESADMNTIASIVVGTLNFLLSDRSFLSRTHHISNTNNDEEYNELVVKKYMKEVKKIIELYLIN